MIIQNEDADFKVYYNNREYLIKNGENEFEDNDVLRHILSISKKWNKSVSKIIPATKVITKKKAKIVKKIVKKIAKKTKKSKKK